MTNISGNNRSSDAKMNYIGQCSNCQEVADIWRTAITNWWEGLCQKSPSGLCGQRL